MFISRLLVFVARISLGRNWRCRCRGWCARAVLGWLCLCGVPQNIFMLLGICRALMCPDDEINLHLGTMMLIHTCAVAVCLRFPGILHLLCIHREADHLLDALDSLSVCMWDWSSELARGLSEILGQWPKSWHIFPIKDLGGNREHALRYRYLREWISKFSL